jgi:hypothetical protein
VAEISARPADSLSDLAATVRAFARARDWEQYHIPRTWPWPWPGKLANS